jgi:hypothetical protein
MIHELRIYHVAPAKMPALLERFEKSTLDIWKKHGIRQAGFWTTMIGESSQQLTYMLAWESLAEREEKWSAVRADTERDGPLVDSFSNQILKPTAFSALK